MPAVRMLHTHWGGSKPGLNSLALCECGSISGIYLADGFTVNTDKTPPLLRPRSAVTPTLSRL